MMSRLPQSNRDATLEQRGLPVPPGFFNTGRKCGSAFWHLGAAPAVRYTPCMTVRKKQLEERLYGLIMGHLAKLADYVPGPIKKAGGTKVDLLKAYSKDPLFRIFGLDSPEYVAATLGGGTVTSIHRKLGDIYEDCVRAVFQHTLGLTPKQLTYAAKIMSGTTVENRAADVYIRFDDVASAKRRKAIRDACDSELRVLADDPKIELIGVGMEVRHCYQTGDSKRAQADEAMARHLLVAGILPLMPLFCNQSSPVW